MKSGKTTANAYFDIESLSFRTEDVLENQRAKIRRKADLLKAMTLEGINQTEVILTFQDQIELRRMRTRVVATADDHVVLAHGQSLPIHSILDVEFL